jgi:hypothetical protein
MAIWINRKEAMKKRRAPGITPKSEIRAARVEYHNSMDLAPQDETDTLDGKALLAHAKDYLIEGKKTVDKDKAEDRARKVAKKPVPKKAPRKKVEKGPEVEKKDVKKGKYEKDFFEDKEE